MRGPGPSMTITLDELRTRADESAVSKLQFQLLLWKFTRPSYDAWADLVEESISFQISEIAKHRHNFRESKEDTITSTLTIALTSLGLSAASAVINGNCDVTVKFDSYLWLGEAKIYTGVAVVWGGYLQLTQRYATALENQNRAGMLLYCQKDSAVDLLAEWMATLAEQMKSSDIAPGSRHLTFLSSDTAQSSGLPIRIIHFAFPLYHNPTEDDLKLSDAAFEAGKLAKKQSRKK